MFCHFIFVCIELQEVLREFGLFTTVNEAYPEVCLVYAEDRADELRDLFAFAADEGDYTVFTVEKTWGNLIGEDDDDITLGELHIRAWGIVTTTDKDKFRAVLDQAIQSSLQNQNTAECRPQNSLLH